MKTNYEQGASAFAASRGLQSGIPPVAVCALGLLDRYGEPAGATDPINDYTADGAIAIRSGTHTLSKATGALMTVGAPGPADNGVRLTIISVSPVAHQINFGANNLLAGVAAKQSATCAAFAGCSFTVVALGGKWVLIGQNAGIVLA